MQTRRGSTALCTPKRTAAAPHAPDVDEDDDGFYRSGSNASASPSKANAAGWQLASRMWHVVSSTALRGVSRNQKASERG